MFTLNKYTKKIRRAVGTTTEALALPFRRARPASTKHPSSKPARRPTLQTDYVRLLQARNDNPTSDAMDIGKADGVRTLDDAFDPPHIANDVASDQTKDTAEGDHFLDEPSRRSFKRSRHGKSTDSTTARFGVTTTTVAAAAPTAGANAPADFIANVSPVFDESFIIIDVEMQDGVSGATDSNTDDDDEEADEVNSILTFSTLATSVEEEDGPTVDNVTADQHTVAKVIVTDIPAQTRHEHIDIAEPVVHALDMPFVSHIAGQVRKRRDSLWDDIDTDGNTSTKRARISAAAPRKHSFRHKHGQTSFKPSKKGKAPAFAPGAGPIDAAPPALLGLGLDLGPSFGLSSFGDEFNPSAVAAPTATSPVTVVTATPADHSVPTTTLPSTLIPPSILITPAFDVAAPAPQVALPVATNIAPASTAVVSLAPQAATQQSDVSLNDFKVLEHLGDGAFGSVDAVLHKRRRDSWALKRIPKARIEKKNVELETMTEQQMLKQLTANTVGLVPELLASFTDQKDVYMVMTNCDGGDLEEAIYARHQTLSLSDVRICAAQLVAKLCHLHAAGIVHNDLKPANVLIAEKKVLLGDLGLATYLRRRCRSRGEVASGAGTPVYMAPEVVKFRDDDLLPYDRRCDWWSLMIILFEMVYKRVPFEDPMVQGYGDDLNLCSRPEFASFNAMIKKGLMINPDHRLYGQALKADPYFQGIDWANIEDQEINFPARLPLKPSAPQPITASVPLCWDWDSFDHQFYCDNTVTITSVPPWSPLPSRRARPKGVVHRCFKAVRGFLSRFAGVH